MSKSEYSRGEKTLPIGELSVHLKGALAAGSYDMGAMVAGEFEVQVEYRYHPGHPGNLHGRWEDAEEPEPPTLEIEAVRAASNVHFDGKNISTVIKHGTDMKELFTNYQLAVMEETILAMIEKGVGND